ncbi:TetR family transcriptional regulator [Malaciobacter molluscorum LMG 25693]|uniref:TetR family transcriptional regulator n=1 Tax=Malaciobacter molluscorum LMG 25693 TaxID=870501 RepID=A0A2G1DGF5_9BACT|nr:TetR/AcrR family transcriptional regulator [Malaciobacter molluscorum]AXX91706.1 transcriptional regulator, TetR/AcrR family [Malaciobacter molluscorum LMG 25693]PHO17406.1 TetR family transcriptional regulator [Malaciobacter molluscorum LMG 25693]RXJ92833.1 TetR family transcriptional regulator [Malaciobacter molluscorum]
MPKIVNKELKRKEIAISCMDLIYDVGIRKLTVDEVAKKANIGKGTVYEYFENKEDIVFEIINMHIQKAQQDFCKKIKKLKTTREKIYEVFSFVLDNSENSVRRFNYYKEYVSIVLSNENENMLKFNCNCKDFITQQIENILNEAVNKGELNGNASELVEVILIFEKGLAFLKMTQKDIELKNICLNFIDLILKKS